jgi:hypothetical protein
MIVNKGFTDRSNVSLISTPRAADTARVETVNILRRRASLSNSRAPMDVVMIRDNEGMTRDIVTGVPPSFNAEARAAWAKRREDAMIEGLFK